MDWGGGVEQDGKDGLSGAGVVDDLSGEEEVVVVVHEGISFLLVLCPLEQKYESVYVG